MLKTVKRLRYEVDKNKGDIQNTIYGKTSNTVEDIKEDIREQYNVEPVIDVAGIQNDKVVILFSSIDL